MEFFIKNQMYIVFLITFVIWIGILFYLFKIEKKIIKLESMDFKNEN